LLDLSLDLDPTRGRQAGLEDALRGAIRAGQLLAGTRLPSSRALAVELGWARATVVSAYEQLAAEGYLHTVRGSATSVATVPSSVDAPAARPRETRRLAADFRPGEPDRSSFPRRDWLASLRAAVTSGSDALFGYDDVRGLPELRSALASYLGRSRAVVADPDRIVVFPGFNSALSALTATFDRLGLRSLAVEDPSLPFHPAIARGSGLSVTPIAVDDEGLRVDLLAESDSRTVLTTPAHQYPMGVTLGAARRTALIAWAREREGWIVEDDYDGEFRYDRQAVGSLQGLDPERVVYAGTSSKMLAPGLGLAWLVVPPGLLEPLLETRRWRLTVSALEQAALAHFIDSGRLDRHVRQMRAAYRRRRDALVATLTPRFDVAGIAAGLHVTMRLPAEGPGERELLDAALAQSISFHPLAAHRVVPSDEAGIVIGYGRPPTHAFPAALDRLSTFLQSALP
jgi:GntR family transcriptional regulator/MocR family aminotransferase